MKRSVLILVTAALLLPLCSLGQGETMAARKQRIMRKYLTEAQAVEQSDLAPAISELEAERLAESLILKDSQGSKISMGGGVIAPRAPMVRQIPVQGRENWFLEEENVDTDLYADPFAMDSGQTESASGTDAWTQWQARQQSMETAREAQAGGVYDYQADSSYSTVGQSSYSSQQGTPPRYSSSSSSYSSYPETAYNPDASGQLGPYGTLGYGSDPLGQLQLPDGAARYEDNNVQRPADSGYTPYTSPYNPATPSPQDPIQSQPQEFMRSTPYQQWRDNNQSWDPSADDAYLNELMQRNQR